MSEDTPETEDDIESEETPNEGDETTPEEGADPTPEAGDEEDIPDLDPDEKADIPEELASQMAEAREEPPEPDDEDGDDDNQETPAEGDEEEGSEGGEEGASSDSGYNWGDVYVDALAIFLLEISAELNEDGNTDMTEEEVRDLATSGPIDVSEAAADVFDQSGIGNDMTPTQALVTGSGFMAFAVLMKETDAAGEMVSRVSEGVNAAELGGEA